MKLSNQARSLVRAFANMAAKSKKQSKTKLKRGSLSASFHYDTRKGCFVEAAKYAVEHFRDFDI